MFLAAEIQIRSVTTCKEHGDYSEQLLRHGFFACAPIKPSMAVDIDMLEYARTQQLTQSPNDSAFAVCLEGTLRGKGFRMKRKACIDFSDSHIPC